MTPDDDLRGDYTPFDPEPWWVRWAAYAVLVLLTAGVLALLRWLTRA